MAASPPPTTWFIVDRVARRTDDEDIVPRGGAIRLELARPPSLTFLALPPLRQSTGSRSVTVHADGNPTLDRTFVVLAAGREAGLLVACSRRDISRLGVAPEGTSLHVLSEDSTTIDVPARDAAVHRPLGSLGNLALMPLPASDGCVVVELQHAAASAAALLMTFRPDPDTAWHWTAREIGYPEAALLHRAWDGDGTFSHDGHVLWVDLCRGILRCDPLDNHPALEFYNLPPGSSVDLDAVGGREAEAAKASRCINVSAGRIRFAEVRRDGRDGAAAMLLWSRDLQAGWRMEERRPLIDIWDTHGDVVPVPELLLVHPRVPEVIYCYVEGHLMALDLRRDKPMVLLEASSCTSWRDVLLWDLPESSLLDHFPRKSGSITLVPGWVVLLGQGGPSELLISAHPAGSNSVLRLRLGTGNFSFAELHMKMSEDNMCVVRIKHSTTDRLLTKVLPSHLCLMTVPIPDFDCIFKAVGVRMEEMKAPREPSIFTGTRVFRGCYTGNGWKVEFVEMPTTRGPVLFLKFHSPIWFSFGAQMLSWPAFHLLIIIRDRRRPDACRIRFHATDDSGEQIVEDVRPGVRMVPLPCLSEIRDAFSL